MNTQPYTPPSGLLAQFWRGIVIDSEPRLRQRLAVAALALVAIVGALDHVIGKEVSLAVFYILPICVAVSGFGFLAGVATSCASVAVWLLGDRAAGAEVFSSPAAFANALFAFCLYVLIAWLFAALVNAQRDLERRVKDRTLAAEEALEGQRRLEHSMLEVAEQERRSIGRQLHDELGQHLTGTAINAQVLAEKLAGHADAEKDAQRLVSLIEEGIEQTRRLARGLLVEESPWQSLESALTTLALEARQRSGIDCTFLYEGGAHLPRPEVAKHLYFIAQEAVRNAERHAHASEIKIFLRGSDLLEVFDNGVGLLRRARDGAGIKIMHERAKIIGWALTVAAQTPRGTVVRCRAAS